MHERAVANATSGPDLGWSMSGNTAADSFPVHSAEHPERVLGGFESGVEGLLKAGSPSGAAGGTDEPMVPLRS